MDNQTQIELEQLYNKNQTLSRLRGEFRIPEVVDRCKATGIPQDFAVDLLSQMVLHKRADAGTLVGLMHRHFGDGTGQEEDLQDCMDMILKAAQHDFIDWDDLAQQFIIRADVSADVYEDLERYQYPLPMVVPPRELKSNRDTGYLTCKNSVILRPGNHHNDDVCLDHINRVNKTRYRINPDTARMVQNQWKDLDRQKPGETEKDFNQRKKAFERYDRVSRDSMEHLFMQGNEFWMTHKYDKRGRTYAQGHHINPQGNAWNKAVIEMYNQEVVSS